jgi:hypothetical protein
VPVTPHGPCISPFTGGYRMAKRKWTDKNGEPTYFKAERVVWESKNLTFSEKGFYSGLKSFRNDETKQTYPSIRTICDRLGMDKKTAYKCRKKLSEIGIIDFSTNRGRKKSCRYRFILEDGDSHEKSIALTCLSINKIGENDPIKNRGKSTLLNRGNKPHEIGENDPTNEKKLTKRKEPHTQEKNDVCVGEDSLKEKKNHLENLTEDLQGLIRLHKALNPKEDIQDLAAKVLAGEWEPPGALSDLSEYIRLSLKGDYVKNPLGLKVAIIKQFKDGTLDLEGGLKDLKGDSSWNI